MDSDVEFSSVIDLNVGGEYFTTRLSTLRKDPDSMLASMFSGRHHLDRDNQGRFFIDRDPSHFHHILNFLRQGKLPPVQLVADVLDEAEYYQIQSLIDWCKQQDSLALQLLYNAFKNAHEISSEDLLLPVSLLAREAEQVIKNSSDRLHLPPASMISDRSTATANLVLHLAVIGFGLKDYDTLHPRAQQLKVDLPAGCSKHGAPPDHLCRVGRWQIPKFGKVDAAVFTSNERRDCVAEVALSVSRFNEAQSSMTLRVEPQPEPQSPHGFASGTHKGRKGIHSGHERGHAGSTVHQLSCLCLLCRCKVFFFELVFEFSSATGHKGLGEMSQTSDL